MGTASDTINQEKRARLEAAAQGGKEGLAQYDAAQRSVAQQRATQAAGLGAESRSAGYIGPRVGGAPTMLSAALNAGLSPFDQALSADKASFGRNLQQGLAANLRYLDQAKAAIGPTLAAARSGGGGGLGGAQGDLTDTQLRDALLKAALGSQASRVKAINDSQAKAAEAAREAAKGATYEPTGPRLLPGVKLDFPSAIPKTGNEPLTGNPADAFGSKPNPALAEVYAAQDARLKASQAAEAERAHALYNLFQQRVARQQRVSSESLLPLATDIGTRAGIDPLLLQGLLTPQSERTFRNALVSGLPPLAKTGGKAAVQPGPVPVEEAAARAGLSKAELAKALGATYVNPTDYSYDPKEKKYVANATGKSVNRTTAVRNMLDDIRTEAQKAVALGLDYDAFLVRLDKFLPSAAVKQNVNALDLGLEIAKGYFVQAAKAVPAKVPVLNPYQRYYESLYPPVRIE